jgi:hypothetical protein
MLVLGFPHQIVSFALSTKSDWRQNTVNLRQRLRLPWAFVFATKGISMQIPLTVTGRDEYGSVFADQVLTENVYKMAPAYLPT